MTLPNAIVTATKVTVKVGEILIRGLVGLADSTVCLFNSVSGRSSKRKRSSNPRSSLVIRSSNKMSKRKANTNNSENAAYLHLLAKGFAMTGATGFLEVRSVFKLLLTCRSVYTVLNDSPYVWVKSAPIQRSLHAPMTHNPKSQNYSTTTISTSSKVGKEDEPLSKNVTSQYFFARQAASFKALARQWGITAEARKMTRVHIDCSDTSHDIDIRDLSQNVTVTTTHTHAISNNKYYGDYDCCEARAVKSISIKRIAMIERIVKKVVNDSTSATVYANASDDHMPFLRVCSIENIVPNLRFATTTESGMYDEWMLLLRDMVGAVRMNVDCCSFEQELGYSDPLQAGCSPYRIQSYDDKTNLLKRFYWLSAVSQGHFWLGCIHLSKDEDSCCVCYAHGHRMDFLARSLYLFPAAKLRRLWSFTDSI